MLQETKQLIKRFCPNFILRFIILPYYLWRRVFGHWKPSFLALDYELYWENRSKEVAGNAVIKSRYLRLELFSKLIPKGVTVLDVGCGDGLILFKLMKKNFIKGIGIDISEKALNIARSLGLEVYNCDLTKPDWFLILPRKKFEYIMVSEVLEHIQNAEDMLIQLRDMFSKELIVTVPNIGFWHWRLRLLFGKFPKQWGWHPGEHVRFWTISDFKWWVKLLDYDIKAIYPYMGTPFFRILFPSLFAYHFAFVLARKRDSRGN